MQNKVSQKLPTVTEISYLYSTMVQMISVMPNDMDLGREVRKLLLNQNNEEWKTKQKLQTSKLES